MENGGLEHSEHGLDPRQLMRGRFECVCFNVRRASRAVTRLYEERLRPIGLHPQQYSLLMGIALGGHLGTVKLAKALSTDRTTLSRNLRPLIAKGWIASDAGEDKRARTYRLTRSGVALIKKAVPIWEETQAEVLEIVGADRFNAIQSAADDLLAHLGEDDAQWLDEFGGRRAMASVDQ